MLGYFLKPAKGRIILRIVHGLNFEFRISNIKKIGHHLKFKPGNFEWIFTNDRIYLIRGL